ncbi:unnamed protein product [Ranitomeya imitator]|uniref:Reverse transcriptase domain-containing protein n=1 Tax=Ranitomeya imitator TaxID=111125 RepID=A0ABN9M3W7_9NEOB|nr:unnamed protein product [Ranitomeya imitator]
MVGEVRYLPRALSDHSQVEVEFRPVGTRIGSRKEWKIHPNWLHSMDLEKIKKELVEFFEINEGSVDVLTLWEAMKAYLRGLLFRDISRCKRKSRETERLAVEGLRIAEDEMVDGSVEDTVAFLEELELPRLSDIDREDLEAPITEEELGRALQSMANGKAPGVDGFPAEIYKNFGEVLIPKLRVLLEEARSGGRLPASMREAIIVVIPKEGKDPTQPDSYRPISLLTTDVKLLAKVFAMRLTSVISGLVHSDQSGFMPDRSTAINLRRLYMNLQLRSDNCGQRVIASLDAHKAFDSVEWGYLWQVLRSMGFGPQFISWIRLMYSMPMARVRVNGELSRTIQLARGTRQGCPLSPLLFALAVEPLAAKLRRSDEVTGFKYGMIEERVALYADDILLFLADPGTSLEGAIGIIERFGSVSGLRINWSKSVLFKVDDDGGEPLEDGRLEAEFGLGTVGEFQYLRMRHAFGAQSRNGGIGIQRDIVLEYTSHKTEASSIIEFAKRLYENTQKDRAYLQRQRRSAGKQSGDVTAVLSGWPALTASAEKHSAGGQTRKLSHSRKLLADHMSILQKISEKLKGNLRQRDEMKTLMEEAIEAKDAANQCLQDLEIHSSAVITELRGDLEYEKQLSDSVKEAYDQQRSYNEELAEFVNRAEIVCSEMEEDRTQLQRQARELMSQHWRLFEVMKEKTQTALGEYKEAKMERDLAVQENEKVTAENDRLKLENSRLGSELELLMDRLCALESEAEQMKEEKSELEELLSAKESSMKLLKKELNEATARGRENQDHVKHLSGWVVPRLEDELSDAVNQNRALQKQLEMLAKEHASQVAYYTESLEFLEQENIVCREQVAETESQLKSHNLTVLDRNYQCESLKDTIGELLKEVSDLQEKLAHSQGKSSTLCKEVMDSSAEVSIIKSHMLELVENLKESAKTKAMESLPGTQTPGQSLVQSKYEELTTTNVNAPDSKAQREGIWSKTSAFTVVHPVATSSTDSQQKNLPDLVRELSRIVTDVVTTSSTAMEKKQQIIEDFKSEISSLKEEIQSQSFNHTSEIRVLQEKLGNLKRENSLLDEKINGKQKCINELQEVMNQQEQKILQQFSEAKKREVLIQESAELQLSLKVYEKQVEVLKQELAQDGEHAARNWIQEKLILHKDLTTLREKLVNLEYSKSESIQRLLRHRDILEANLSNSEAEVRKLDLIIERIRQILLSIPDVVDNCEKLRQLKEFLK